MPKAYSWFSVVQFFCCSCRISVCPIGLILLSPSSGVFAFRSPIVIWIALSSSLFCMTWLKNLVRSSPRFVGLQ